jgi:uncharacterized membrane protein YkoI
VTDTNGEEETIMITKATALLAAVALGGAVSASQAANAAREDQNLSEAKVSLTQAIGIAEKQGSGQAVDADYTAKHGGKQMGYYDVKVLSSDGSKLTKYEVDPMTGKITEASNQPFEKVFTRIKPTDLQNAPTSLKSAITTAESQSGGKAVDADTDKSGNTVRYTVKVAKADGTTEKVKINGTNGKVASAK